MEQRISLITLGVTSLERARVFYERLGWRSQVVEETVFFQTGGSALILWGRDELAVDSGISDGGATADGADFTGVVVAQNVRSAAEVDDIMAAAEAAGATVTRPPAETFYGGFVGGFTHPPGHAWGGAPKPRFALAPGGGLPLPNFSCPA